MMEEYIKKLAEKFSKDYIEWHTLEKQEENSRPNSRLK